MATNESGYMGLSNDKTIRRMKGDGDVHKGVKHKLDAAAAPTVDDDITAGYQAGSIWIINTAGDATDGDIYMCSDGAEGAAVWAQIHNAA